MFSQLLNYFTTKAHFTIFIVIMPFLLVKAQGYTPESGFNLEENKTKETAHLTSHNQIIFSSEANIFISKDALLYINRKNEKASVASNSTKKAISKNKTLKKRFTKKIILKQNDTQFSIPISTRHFSYFGDTSNDVLTIPQLLYFNFKRAIFLIYSLGKISQEENSYSKDFKLKSSYHLLLFCRPPPIDG